MKLNRIAAYAAFLLMASGAPALAGPLLPAFAAVAGFLGVSTGVVILATINLGVSAAMSVLQRKKMKNMKNDTGGGIRVDRKLSGGINSRSAVVGFYSTEGAEVCPPMSHGNPNEVPNAWLVHVVSLSDIPIEGISRIAINGEWVPVDWDNQHFLGFGASIGGKYQDRAWIKFYDGTQTAADPYLVRTFANDPERPWTAQHIGFGCAYAIMTYQIDPKIFTGEPRARFELRGARIYDPRRDSSRGGSGPQRWGVPSTYEYSENPMVIEYNNKLGFRLGDGSIWGGKAELEDLPLNNWVAAMNVCDEMVNGVRRYRAGYEIFFADDEPADVTDEMTLAASAEVAEIGGLYKVRAGGPGLPVAFMTDGDFLVSRPDEYDPFPATAASRNTITATFPHPAEVWQTHDAPRRTVQAYLDEDDGEVIPTHISLSAVPFPVQVQRLMLGWLNDDRRWRIHTLAVGPYGFAVEPLDVIEWTSVKNGYDRKLFDIEKTRENLFNLCHVWNMREVDPTDYDWNNNFELPDPVAPGGWVLPVIQTVPGFQVEPVIIRDQDGNPRAAAVRATWAQNGAVDANALLIKWRVLGQTEETTKTISDPSERSADIIRVVSPQTQYEFAARYTVPGRRTEFTLWQPVTTYDIRLGSLDVEYDRIIEEVRNDLGELIEYIDGTGEVIRGVQDEVDAIRDGVAEGLFGIVLDRDQLRREIAAESAANRAAFEEQIDVIVTDQLAASIFTSTLRAQFNSTTAMTNETLIALARDDDALAARLDDVEAAVGGASGGASDSLIVRVSEIERVAGTRNRVWRQPFPGPEGAQVTVGDYWQNTGNGNWLERRSDNTWSLIPASSVPRIIIEQAATADAITQVTARTNRGTASGLLRATAVSTPAGALARVALAAEASDGAFESLAALFLEARGDGSNQIIATANRFAIATGNGPADTRRIPFVVDGENVFMQNAIVRTLSIGNDQVVVPVGARGAIISQAGEGVWRNLLTLNVPLNQVGRLAVAWSIRHYYYSGGFGAYGLRIQLNGVTIEEKDTNGLPADFPAGNAFGLGVEGVNVVRLDWQGWGAEQLEARGAMSILGVMR